MSSLWSLVEEEEVNVVCWKGIHFREGQARFLLPVLHSCSDDIQLSGNWKQFLLSNNFSFVFLLFKL